MMFDTLSIDLQDRWRGYQQRYKSLYNPLFQEAFGEEYEGHELFAYHAAFPGIVTPDLLYQIWFNFRVYPSRHVGVGSGSGGKKRIFAFPNFLVSDFLQSSLCEEVGHRQYAINRELRACFLEELKADERFGEKRLLSLATLLEQYRQQKPKLSEQSGLAEYHHWVARATLNPQAMARDFGEQLRGLIEQVDQDRSKMVEIRKMKRLLKDLSRTEQAFQDLAEYSEVMDDYLVGKKVAAGRQAVLSNVPQGPGAVALPVYRELKEELGLGDKEYVRQPFEKGKNKVYALVVGINRYQVSSIPDLSGPVKDALAVDAYLSETFDEDTLEIKTLIDEEATKEKIIRGFLDHLGTAGPGDVVFFFFAGQGSQEPAAELFWNLEPDKKLETILAHDSRSIGHRFDRYDLTYRELSALIWLLDKRKPNILMVVDACHSGKDHEEYLVEAAEEGIDYDLPEQQAYGEEQAEENDADDFFQQSRDLYFDALSEPRPLDEFLFMQMDEFKEEFRQHFQTNERLSTFPEGSHVYLSSGMSHEQAYEQTIDGEFRGVFSYEFLEVLKGTRNPSSNAEIIDDIQARVKERQTEQTPQLYVSGEVRKEDEFLFGALDYKKEEEYSPFLMRLASVLAPSRLKIKEVLSRTEVPNRELFEAVSSVLRSPFSSLLKDFVLVRENEKVSRLLAAYRWSQSLLFLVHSLLLMEVASFKLRQPDADMEELGGLLYDFLNSRAINHEGYDMLLGIQQCLGYLSRREHEFFLQEWKGFVEIWVNEAWMQAYEFFLGSNDEEIVVEDRLIEDHLLALLQPFLFLTKYQIISVKDVLVQAFPHQKRPEYQIHYVDLKDDQVVNPPQKSFLHTQLMDNPGILFLKRGNEFLNLYPLFVDKRSMDGALGCHLHLFSHRNQGGDYVYRQVQAVHETHPEEILVSAYSYPEVWELMQRLDQVLTEDNTQSNGGQSVYQRVSSLLFESRIDEVIDLLDEKTLEIGEDSLFRTDVILLARRYDLLISNQTKGTISQYDAEQELNQISNALLQIAQDIPEDSTQSSGGQSVYQRVSSLLRESRVAEVIEFLENYSQDRKDDGLLEEVTLQARRYEGLLSNQENQVISQDDAEIVLNQITNALLEIAQNIESR